MAKSILNCTVEFGTINVPVKVFNATGEKDVAFNTLHDECKSRLKQKRWCPVHDREVFSDEVIRAYEYVTDQYVEISNEELANLPVEAMHKVQISNFVDDNEIDRTYVKQTYYLEPDQAAIHPFALLLRSMRDGGVAAVATVALRNSERLCLLRPTDKTLMMELLYWPDEVRLDQIPAVPDVIIPTGELEIMGLFIERTRTPFDPKAYHDNYRDAVLALVEAKVNKREFVGVPVSKGAALATPPQDLMAQLRASIEQAKAKSAVPEPAPVVETPAPRSRRRAVAKKAA